MKNLRRFQISASALLGMGVFMAGCSGGEDVDSPTGGSSSGGGSNAGASTGGATFGGGPSAGAGGGTNTGGAATGTGVVCPTPAAGVLTDFTLPEGATATDAITFGDFTMTLSGGTYVYFPPTSMYPLTSDMTGNSWHMT